MALTRLELFTKLEADGLLAELMVRGVINKKMHGYFKIYREVQYQHLSGNLDHAVMKTADKLNVSERTVWRALKAIRK